jgi:hypothetical protein
MRKFLLAVAALLVISGPAFAIDLSATATDLTSIGLPGYFGERVDCAASQITALTLAVNPTYEPLVIPGNGQPAQGRSTTSPATDPTRYYVLVIWSDHDPSPPSGDGQPSWPSTCVKSNAAASAALIGILDGVPVDGF